MGFKTTPDWQKEFDLKKGSSREWGYYLRKSLRRGTWYSDRPPCATLLSKNAEAFFFCFGSDNPQHPKGAGAQYDSSVLPARKFSPGVKGNAEASQPGDAHAAGSE